MENKLILLLAAMALLSFGCYKEHTVLQSEVIINMAADSISIPADGVSKVGINVELNSKTTDANNSVVFTTTKGVFDVSAKNSITVTAQNITKNDGLHKIATVYLISSNDEGIANVTASIKNYSQVIPITISRAYPSQIHVNLDKLNYQLGVAGELTITVQIKRNIGNGLPSAGQVITLSAVDASSNVVGTFRNLNLVTDATGTCTNYFSLPIGSTYTGPVKITATVAVNATGKTISDTQMINVYK